MPLKHRIEWKILAFGAMAAVFVFLLIKPSSLEAAGPMEINNNVLVRYDIKDGRTEVGIPETVIAIGNEAFMGDKTLERIYIPDSVKIIGSKAFYGCENLKEITLRGGTAEIRDSAFAMCTSLYRVYLPRSLKKLGNGVFAGDTALNDVTIESGNSSFFINDKVIYNIDSTKVIEMIPGRQEEYYEMPFSVRSIAPYAFWGAEHLKGVRVSNNVTSITPFAFTNASAMEFIYLPNSVRSIEEYAFRNCGSLKYIGVEGTITYIDDSAFSGIYNEVLTESGVQYGDVVNSYGTKTGKKAKAEASGKAESKASGSGDQKSQDKSAEETKEDEGSNEEVVTDGGSVVFDTPWGINAPYRDIDTSDPALYGTGRIVGGRTFIIRAK